MTVNQICEITNVSKASLYRKHGREQIIIPYSIKGPFCGITLYKVIGYLC
jgi:hypothetical protein